MKQSEQMIGPDFFRKIREDAKKDIKKPKEGDDDLLLAMSQSDAWELLESIVETIKEGIDKGTKQIAGQATTWEEVGKAYFAKEIAIDSIQSVLDIVNLRRDADHAEKSVTE